MDIAKNVKSNTKQGKVQHCGKVIRNKAGIYAGEGSRVKVQMKKSDIEFEDTIKAVFSGIAKSVDFESGLMTRISCIEDFQVVS